MSTSSSCVPRRSPRASASPLRGHRGCAVRRARTSLLLGPLLGAAPTECSSAALCSPLSSPSVPCGQPQSTLSPPPGPASYTAPHTPPGHSTGMPTKPGPLVVSTLPGASGSCLPGEDTHGTCPPRPAPATAPLGDGREGRIPCSGDAVTHGCGAPTRGLSGLFPADGLVPLLPQDQREARGGKSTEGTAAAAMARGRPKPLSLVLSALSHEAVRRGPRERGTCGQDGVNQRGQRPWGHLFPDDRFTLSHS